MKWYFTEHARRRMKERGIKKPWVIHAIANHDTVAPCKGNPHLKTYYGAVADGRRLKVWVDEKHHRIVTVVLLEMNSQ